MAIIEITFQRDPATGQVLFNTDGYPIYGTNTGANTYAQLRTRVLDEVLGSVTDDQANNAIQDAINTFDSQSFWFNNMRVFGDVTGSTSDLQTVRGKEFYSYQDLPSLVNMPHISKMMVFAFNNRYDVISRDPQWIDDQSLSPTWQGVPTDWCWQAGSIRLYPIPNGGYPLILNATIRFPPVVNDADYSVWTNRAEGLIRQEAKRLLYTNITRDPDQASAMQLEIYGNPALGRQGMLATLRRESTRRSAGPVRMRASRGYM